jgi:hypothetical protein
VVLASEFDVPDGVGSPLADRDDVIELKSFLRAAHDAATLIAPPDLPLHVSRNRLTMTSRYGLLLDPSPCAPRLKLLL